MNRNLIPTGDYLWRKIIKTVFTKLILGALALVTVVLIGLRFGVLPYVDWKSNAVVGPSSYAVPDRVRAFHDHAFIADLHADSLLWKRDLSKRHSRGHVDLPRLNEGRVDLQVFGVVTKVPKPLSYVSNSGDSDKLPLLFLASWRSPETWFKPKARALAQARELADLVERSNLSLVLSRGDLAAEGIKGVLSLEGMHALEGKAENLMEFYTEGFRMMGLAHHFDNKIAGSAHGVSKYGLTGLGRSLIPQMEQLGITIDLSHASPKAFEETLALATKPVVVSHGGVKGTCPGPKSLSDDQLRGIADNGGVVGIGFGDGAICDTSLQGIVAAIRYAIEIAGIDHVGLGSDFDGKAVTPFDVTGVVSLTEALFDAGLSKNDIGKVLGGNVRRVLAANLPK